MKDIDFERVVLLIDVLDRCRPHGPAFNPIMEQAQKELSDIMADMKPQNRIVTPPDGPANSAVQNPDGTYTRLPQAITQRLPGETDEQYEARKQERAELIDKINKDAIDPQTDNRPVANPRANERPAGDDRPKEEIEKDRPKNEANPNSNIRRV